MRPTIILWILASIGPIARGQLNFRGNPLTENTDYLAEETHFSERNARRDYERFEIADGRTVSASSEAFTPSSRDLVAVPDKGTLSKTEESSKTKKEASEMGPFAPSKKRVQPTESKLRETQLPNESTKTPPEATMSQRNSDSRPEARQLSDYPVQSMLISSYRSAQSQNLSPAVQQSQPYATVDQSSNPRSHDVYSLEKTSPMSLASGQALNRFLKSRTPEESQIALQNYFRIRDHAARSVGQTVANSLENTIQTGALSNDAMTSQESLSDAVPSSPGLRDTTIRDASYFPIQQHPANRWNQVGQSRQDGTIGAAPGRRPPPMYRGHMVPMGKRNRGNPWSQPRIGAGPPIYHRHRGAIFAGPPSSPLGPTGKWKPPVEVIYTKPPGYGHGPPSNPIPYDDASRWFPDADGDHPPPQKDVLYSQLYAQSYDPHYYNYIAKTGKVKPWLYGKLGEHKEKSIWWELFSGFKKHGMKNIMNPMFLLGMTIPTITFMLTALVQKRSIGRSLSGDRATDEIVEEYAKRVQEAIECYEKRAGNSNNDRDNKCW